MCSERIFKSYVSNFILCNFIYFNLDIYLISIILRHVKPTVVAFHLNLTATCVVESTFRKEISIEDPFVELKMSIYRLRYKQNVN